MKYANTLSNDAVDSIQFIIYADCRGVARIFEKEGESS